MMIIKKTCNIWIIKDQTKRTFLRQCIVIWRKVCFYAFYKNNTRMGFPSSFFFHSRKYQFLNCLERGYNRPPNQNQFQVWGERGVGGLKKRKEKTLIDKAFAVTSP